jgi:hypothetical protein
MKCQHCILNWTYLPVYLKKKSALLSTDGEPVIIVTWCLVLNRTRAGFVLEEESPWSLTVGTPDWGKALWQSPLLRMQELTALPVTMCLLYSLNVR